MAKIPLQVVFSLKLVAHFMVFFPLMSHSSHPYLFFNQDGMSFTFVGFVVTVNGDLRDPAHPGVILEKGIMTQQLYTGLKAQRVNFNEDYRHWPKNVMIQKISTVMGIEWPHDPDPTYVLTVDNLIKILAIQMRFRFVIRVIYGHGRQNLFVGVVFQW